jgi:hypothetical protein
LLNRMMHLHVSLVGKIERATILAHDR